MLHNLWALEKSKMWIYLFKSYRFTRRKVKSVESSMGRRTTEHRASEVLTDP